MRWNAVCHTKRPSASNRGARRAWDYFAEPNWCQRTKSFVPETRTPKKMSYCFMDYWVWVMEYTNGDYDEIEAAVISYNSRQEKTRCA